MNATTLKQPNHEEQLAEILEAYLADLEAGRAPSEAELLQRHPDLATDLETCLASLEFVGAAGLAPDREAVAAAVTAAPASRVLGDFRILREIGRGGMGIVYEAEQISLGRRVALKILPFAGVLDPRRRQRFTTEAQAAALLHHQNIVPVYQIDCERGVHYYAMQYVDGQTLAEVIRGMRNAECGMRNEEELSANSEFRTPNSALETRPVAAISTHHSADSKRHFEAVARLGIQAAEALEHAHQSGIIHRDIKPGNLLIECSGKLWITDFGLARIEAETNLTVSGDLLGTIRYMSPEQALAKRVTVDHRTDIYSLGATLFELLTLEPLVAGEDRAEILHKIAFQEPRPPRRTNKRVPAELDTIVLKAISKGPDERYASAQEMADDLRRFLDDQPILARRPTMVHRVRKWTRRHRQVVAACAALLAVVLLTVGPLVAWNEHRRAEQAERARAELAATQAELKQKAYNLGIGSAYQAWLDNNVPYVRELLALSVPDENEPDLRGFEWFWLNGLCQQAAATETFTTKDIITSIAVSPDGRYLAACGADLHVPSGSDVIVWDLSTQGFFQRIEANAHCVAFSHDETSILTGHHSHQLRRWDVATGEELSPVAMPDSGDSDFCVRVVRCSADGKWVAATSGPPLKPLILLSSLTGGESPVLRIRDDDVGVCDVALSPDSRMLVTAGSDGGLWRWSPATGEPLGEPWRGHSKALVVAFSPSGQLLASGGEDGSVNVWDAVTGKVRRRLTTDGGEVTAITFLDEDLVAVGSYDKTVTVWKWKIDEAGTNEQPAVEEDELRVHKGHAASITGLAYLPNRSLLISGGKDGRINLWDTLRTEQKSRLDVPGFDWGHQFLDFSPDSKTLAIAGPAGLPFWALPSLAEKLGLAAGSAHVAFAPDGRLFGTTYWDEDAQGFRVRLWDAVTREPLSTLPDIQALPQFSPDGRRMLTSWREITLWDVTNGRKPVKTGSIDDYGYKCGGGFFPERNWIFIGGVTQPRIGIWDAESRKQVGRDMQLAHLPRCGAVSSDERLLAVGTMGATIELWDVASQRRVKTLKGHGDVVAKVDFSPDGRTLASGSGDRTVKLWNVATAELLLTLDEHHEEISEVRFSPDGQYLVTAGKSGLILVHRASPR